MSEWSDAVEFAIKRSGKKDKGAAAARAGILGLENPETGEKAERCYNAAHTAREAMQRGRERHRKPPIQAGTTGNGQWDQFLGVT